MKINATKYDKRTGRYFTNELAFFVRPYYLVPDNYIVNPATPSWITIPANNWSSEVRMRAPYGGVFEGAYMIMPDISHDHMVYMRDMSRSVPITGRPCLLNTLFPEQRWTSPFVLPEAIFLDEKEEIAISFQNIDNNEEDVMPIIMGRISYPRKVTNNALNEHIRRRRMRSRQMSPYFCPLDENPTIAGSGESEVWFTQSAISHFEVRKISYFCVDAGGGPREFKFKIIDEDGQELTNNWVRSNAGMGSDCRPFHTFGPWGIRAGGKVKFILHNQHTANVTIYITLIGRQFFI
jgi:hypothetical protein